MIIPRRNFLKAALATALTLPLSVWAAGENAPYVEYTGPDDPKAYNAFVGKQAAGAVVVSVFHAKWCAPCRQLFTQLDTIQKEPGVKIKIVGLDVGPLDFLKGPYKNILAAHQVKSTPQIEFFAAGDFQYKTAGTFQNVPEITRYLRDLSRAVHDDQPASPRP